MIKVLHIENDSEWREIVADYLNSNFVQVVGCGSIAEAKAVLATNTFDAIICDGNLHKHGDGWEFAEQLHRDGYKVIVLAGLMERHGIPYADKGHWPDHQKEHVKAFVTS